VSGPAAYYGYSLNPFENYLITTRLQTRVDDKLTLSAEPYFWYGYGTGGTQQNTLAESAATGTKLGNGVGDINENGLLTDTVGIYRGSGDRDAAVRACTFKANYAVDNHKILGRLLARAREPQADPAGDHGRQQRQHRRPVAAQWSGDAEQRRRLPGPRLHDRFPPDSRPSSPTRSRWTASA
jgi:hypothetical protein